MFKREVKSIKELILYNLRQCGLETPLLQRRLIESWPEEVGPVVAKYTNDLKIFNQILFVHVSNPSLRSDLMMNRQKYVDKLNHRVGAQIITDIRFR